MTRRVRAYFAPVNRATGQPTIFDAAQSGRFLAGCSACAVGGPGVVHRLWRKTGKVVSALRAGAPAVVQSQVRTEIEATVQLEFQSWGKLQLALASGSQQMNLLVTAGGAAQTEVGARAQAAVPLCGGGASTATTLNVGATAACGVYGGRSGGGGCGLWRTDGFVGSGVSGGWVRAAADVGGDVNYIRRVTLNVGRVISIAGGVLQLGAAFAGGSSDGGYAGEPADGFVRSRGGKFFPGVVGTVLHGWRAGGSGAVSLSAAAGDAVFGRDRRGAGGTGWSGWEAERGFRALPVKDVE